MAFRARQLGRLGRTLDQATKIIDFVERFSAGYDRLAKVSEVKRADVEKLMLDTMQAVREDFAAERAVLPEFGKTTSSFRNALMLYIPNRTIVWLTRIMHHAGLFCTSGELARPDVPSGWIGVGPLAVQRVWY